MLCSVCSIRINYVVCFSIARAGVMCYMMTSSLMTSQSMVTLSTLGSSLTNHNLSSVNFCLPQDNDNGLFCGGLNLSSAHVTWLLLLYQYIVFYWTVKKLLLPLTTWILLIGSRYVVDHKTWIKICMFITLIIVDYNNESNLLYWSWQLLVVLVAYQMSTF